MSDESATKEAAVDAALEDRTISDLKSFDKHTRGQQALAGLYAFLKLDVLVTAARKVSLDFFARPEIYRGQEVADVAPELAAMFARYGCDEEHLSCEQRHAIYVSLFGDEAAADPFAPSNAAATNGVPVATNGLPVATNGSPVMANHYARERDQLLAATAAFAERVFDTGERPLRDAVGVMIPGLRSYLSDLDHAMVQWVRGDGLGKLTEETSYKILRNPGIARAFGLGPPSKKWPYQEEADGTTLVAEISSRLGGCPQPISRQEFIDRQRVALRGAEAVATVLDFADGRDVDSADMNLLISKCYTWYAARGRELGIPLATMAIASTEGAPPATYHGNRRLFSSAKELTP